MSVALSWSGGKDSALALWVMREELGVEPASLLTTLTEDYDRVSMHAVRRSLLEAQAAAVGVPLVEALIPAACVNEVYEERMAAALDSPPLAAVEEFAFADLFLEDIRAYREERLAAVGRRATFPLWGRDTAALAARFVEAGFAATLVCVDPRRLDPSFAGRAFDADLLRDLPAGVDPCGENGEFHTFVTAGPIFSAPVAVAHGETVERDGFVFHDLLPAA
ncbi:MAG: adenine nucleotide alpha hydrolase [Actinobacteria bacterium]|nr:adenine nucleotide alpha hydrolase [Actinomycetota bacterium]